MNWLTRWFRRGDGGQSSSPLQLRLQDIPGAWAASQAVPSWKIVHAWVKRELPKEQHASAYWALTQSWLDELCEDFGKGYSHLSTKNFRILSSVSPKMARRRGEFLELTRERLVRLLGSLAWLEGEGPHVVLIFRDSDDYYRYYSHYAKDGEQGGSVGVFIRAGYAHIATHNCDVWQLENTLAHELLHNLVAPLPIPLWLNEGLAQLAPETVGLMSNSMQIILQDQGQIRECFQRFGIEEFWSGASFSKSDDRQRRSYQLAEILTRNLLTHPHSKGKFAAFIAEAHRRDAGEAAARKHLGRSLSEAVGEFLGPGKWGESANGSL